MALNLRVLFLDHIKILLNIRCHNVKEQKVIGWVEINTNKVIIFNIWRQILCSHWVWNQTTLLSYFPWWCSASSWTAAIFTSCLFRGEFLPPVWSLKVNTSLVGLRSWDWFGKSKTFHCLTLKMLRIIVLLHGRSAIQWCICLGSCTNCGYLLTVYFWSTIPHSQVALTPRLWCCGWEFHG